MAKKKTTKEFIEEAKAVHGDKYNYSEVKYVNISTKVRIICKDHGHFTQSPYSHLKGCEGCKACASKNLKNIGVTKRVSTEDYIKKARLVHSDRYNYDKVQYTKAHSNIVITCKIHGDFEQSANSHLKGRGCSSCSGKKKKTTEDFIKDAKAVHGDTYTYEKVHYKRALEKVIITCAKHGDFKQKPNGHLGGEGCPACNRGWTTDSIKKYIKGLLEDGSLQTMSEATKFLLFKSCGLMPRYNGRRREDLVAQLIQGDELPIQDVEDWVNDTPSEDNAVEILLGNLVGESPSTQEESVVREIDNEEILEERARTLPEVTQVGILRESESLIHAKGDEELFDFMVKQKVSKLWSQAYKGEEDKKIYKKLDNYAAETVRSTFVEEFKAAKNMKMPKGYKFKDASGKLIEPFLMQKHTATQLVKKGRLGNWSGTGAGKTLSAILASRLAKAKVTVVICPNAVVDNWDKSIKASFDNVTVYNKEIPSKLSKKNNYIVLNYDKFSRDGIADKMTELLKTTNIDMIVIDELHYVKVRGEETSGRRARVQDFCVKASDLNSDMKVLAMTATPVINNLTEAISLIDLVTGYRHEELGTRATVDNCLEIHKHLHLNGIRWMPDYDTYKTAYPEIDISGELEEIQEANEQGTSDIEPLLVEYKTDTIIKNLEKGTLIYCQFVTGIVDKLKKSIEAAGWSVGFYHGGDKSGYEGFISGDVDVLIGSQCISTGVDGLQNVSRKVIVASAPWTAADYEQLIGRVVRTGQKRKCEIIFPVCNVDYSVEVNGVSEDRRWSYDQTKKNRIRYKSDIADACCDGSLPKGSIKSENDAKKGLNSILERILNDDRITIKRDKLK